MFLMTQGKKKTKHTEKNFEFKNTLLNSTHQHCEVCINYNTNFTHILNTYKTILLSSYSFVLYTYHVNDFITLHSYSHKYKKNTYKRKIHLSLIIHLCHCCFDNDSMNKCSFSFAIYICYNGQNLHPICKQLVKVHIVYKLCHYLL